MVLLDDSDNDVHKNAVTSLVALKGESYVKEILERNIKEADDFINKINSFKDTFKDNVLNKYLSLKDGIEDVKGNISEAKEQITDKIMNLLKK